MRSGLLKTKALFVGDKYAYKSASKSLRRLLVELGSRMKFALTGAHGTGKTTLTKSLLARVKNAAVCREMPRVICERVGDPTFFQRRNNTLQRQLLLFTYQVMEEGKLQKSADVTICDRTVVDHLAYTLNLFPESAEAPEVAALCSAVADWLASYDHIFYVPIEFEVESDGTREDDQAFQAAIDQEIVSLYKRFGVSTTRVTGTVDARTSTVLSRLGL